MLSARDLQCALARREAAVNARDLLQIAYPHTPRGVMRTEHIDAGLIDSGTAHAVAQQLARDADSNVHEWIAAAIDADYPIAVVERMTGVSRATIYRRHGIAINAS
jgi:hypothetical protein